MGISVKGSYYPSNKEPKNGERKLFLFLEARSEIALRRAREEILRIMKDAFRQMVCLLKKSVADKSAVEFRYWGGGRGGYE